MLGRINLNMDGPIPTPPPLPPAHTPTQRFILKSPPPLRTVTPLPERRVSMADIVHAASSQQQQFSILRTLVIVLIAVGLGALVYGAVKKRRPQQIPQTQQYSPIDGRYDDEQAGVRYRG